MSDSYQWHENLTEREQDILRLLADGLSNNEIADRLFIAPSTVKWYVRQLNSKFGTENRDAIVEQAQALGLLNTDDSISLRQQTPHNLLKSVTPFIGRAQDITDIQAILAQPDVRLLTILGTGGMGKTRLALEIAHQQLMHFSGGVFMVELAPISIFDTQLSASLKFLAENLRRGYNMAQGFAWIAELAPEPTAGAFRNLCESLQQGTPLLEAMMNLQQQLQSPHFDRFVTMFQRQLSEGGNFADRLDELIAWLQTQISSDAWFDPRLPDGLFQMGRLLLDDVPLPQVLRFASENLAEPYRTEFEQLFQRSSEIDPLEALDEFRKHFHSRHYDRFCEAIRQPNTLLQMMQWLEQEIQQAPQRHHNSSINTIASAIAQACQIPLPMERYSALNTIRAFFAEKKVLLLLDNWEHLLDGAEIIAQLLQSAPDLKVLATSRERLNLTGETIFPLRGLTFPSWETPQDALQYDAVQLLLQSAQRVRPDFQITPENLDTVTRVCRITEGMPLGIILAVSWLDTLSLHEIEQEIQQSADFLETEMRDLPERQRSIRAVFRQTWNRLQPAEQEAFMKCSVFRGGFTRASAEAVAGINMRTLQVLVNKALIMRDAEGRYDIHGLLRQYGETALRASGQETNTYSAYVAYFSSLMLSYDKAMHSAQPLPALQAISRDFENIRLAWYYALEQQRIDQLDQLLQPLSLYLLVGFNGRLDDLFNLLNDTRQLLDHLPDSIAVRLVRGRVALHQLRLVGEVTRVPTDTTEHFDVVLDTLRHHAEPAFVIFALLVRASIPVIDDASLIYQEALAEEAHQQVLVLRDPWLLPISFNTKARLLIERDAPITSIQTQYELALQYARQSGSPLLIAVNLFNLGTLKMRCGDYETAIQHLEDAIHHEIGLNRSMILDSRLVLAELELIRGNLEIARELAQSCLDEARQLNWRRLKIFALHRHAVTFAIDDFTIAEKAAQEILSYGLPDLAFTVLFNSSVERLDDVRANRYFEELCTVDEYIWCSIKLNAGIAKAHLGHTNDAYQWLMRGLEEVYQKGWKRYFTSAVYGFAVLAFQQGDLSSAFHYAQLVQAHPTTEYVILTRARHLLSQLQAQVSESEWQQLHTMPISETLETLVQALATRT